MRDDETWVMLITRGSRCEMMTRGSCLRTDARHVWQEQAPVAMTETKSKVTGAGVQAKEAAV